MTKTHTKIFFPFFHIHSHSHTHKSSSSSSIFTHTHKNYPSSVSHHKNTHQNLLPLLPYSHTHKFLFFRITSQKHTPKSSSSSSIFTYTQKFIFFHITSQKHFFLFFHILTHTKIYKHKGSSSSIFTHTKTYRQNGDFKIECILNGPRRNGILAKECHTISDEYLSPFIRHQSDSAFCTYFSGTTLTECGAVRSRFFPNYVHLSVRDTIVGIYRTNSLREGDYLENVLNYASRVGLVEEAHCVTPQPKSWLDIASVPQLAAEFLTPTHASVPRLISPFYSTYSLDSHPWLEENVLVRLYDQQALAGNMKVYHSFGGFGGDGVYEPALWEKTHWLHAVLICGYGIFWNKPYYLIQNSEGPDWAQHVFAMVARHLFTSISYQHLGKNAFRWKKEGRDELLKN